MNIILFGYKGCGKTTLGKLIAAKLGYRFVDVDQLIEELYEKRKQSVLPAYQVYERSEAAFRLLERETVESLDGTKNAVIAVAGGTVLDMGNVTELKRLGKLVYLFVEKEVLKERMLSGRLPAFLDPKDPEGSFEKMYQNRKKIYASVADIVLEKDSKTDEQIVDEIIREVKNGK